MMLEIREKQKEVTNWPANLYLEGQDQFRGWFNSSLITSIILKNKPPYKEVLSHGFVVDENGKKMSKSLGNVVDPEKLIEKFGADVLRLWVVSSDFTKELKISENILVKIKENYQKIRNSFRFILGNINSKKEVDINYLPSEKNLNLFDYFILYKLKELKNTSEDNYKQYNLNAIFSSLIKFCNDLSSFYFEISKDCLYCDDIGSEDRNKVVITLRYLLSGLLEIVYPILPYLAEEVYQSIPSNFAFSSAESIFLSEFIDYKDFPPDIEEKIKLAEEVIEIRKLVYQELEKSRQEKLIDTNSQASLVIHLTKKSEVIKIEKNLLEKIFLVSEVILVVDDKHSLNDFVSIEVSKSKKNKCARCWNYRDLDENNILCLRCSSLMKKDWNKNNNY